MHRKQKRGFTLIELIVVIVILSILSIIAMPRFIDISSDARVATLQGLKATFESSTTLIYAKAQIKGLEKSESYVQLDYNGRTITTRYGYFAYSPDPVIAAADFNTILDLSIPKDWDFTYEPGVTQGATRSRISPSGINIVTDPRVLGQIQQCFLEHVVSTGVGDRPEFIVDTNC